MKIRRIGNALLKSHPSPLLSFLAPSVPTSLWNINSSQHFPIFKCVQSRTQLRRLASGTPSLEVPVNATAQVQEEDLASSADGSGAGQPRRAQTRQEDIDGGQEIDDMLDLFPEPDPPSRNSSNPHGSNPDQPKQTSADLLNSRRSSLNTRTSLLGNGIVDNRTLSDQGAFAQAMTGVDYSYYDRGPLPRLRPPVRLDAFIGRSEEVDPSRGNDLARKLRSLEIKLSLNKVRADFNYQRFHERAGLKRKRLKSERWRKRFKIGFKAVVKKVQDMRKRGW